MTNRAKAFWMMVVMKQRVVVLGFSAILLAVTAGSPSGVSADDVWLDEFDEAAAAAKRQGKDILIDFSGTDWCAPCKRLWNQTLSKPEFIQLASQRYVLLNIDKLVYEAMPEGRKDRYLALQDRYQVHAWPTVVLATSEGLPYAATGLLDDKNNPIAYWRHLELHYERGQKFKAALEAAGGTRNLVTAKAIVAALSELRPDFVVTFYGDKLNQLRRLTPADETGYLAFIDRRAALVRLESKLYEEFSATSEKWSDGQTIESRWVKSFSPADVNALIQKYEPEGASLLEALVVRLFLEIDIGNFSQALNTLRAISDIEGPSSRFEQANFMHFSVRSRDALRRDIDAARRITVDKLAQLRSLYCIMKDDLQWTTTTPCCTHSFTLQLHYLMTGATYGRMLLDSTAHLETEARAAAIGKGLEGIELYANGSIGRIVCELMPELVGKEAAIRYLPPRYADWLRD